MLRGLYMPQLCARNKAISSEAHAAFDVIGAGSAPAGSTSRGPRTEATEDELVNERLAEIEWQRLCR